MNEIAKIKNCVMTDNAIDIMEETCTCYKYRDGIFYQVQLEENSPFWLLISLTGDIYLISVNNKKKMSNKIIEKIITKLLNLHIFKILTPSPFEEFERYRNIKANMLNMKILNCSFFAEDKS